MLQTFSVFMPVILSAVCIPSILRHAGYPKEVSHLAWLPTIIAVFSMLAVLTGDRPLLHGPLGTWAIAAFLLPLSLLE